MLFSANHPMIMVGRWDKLTEVEHHTWSVLFKK